MGPASGVAPAPKAQPDKSMFADANKLYQSRRYSDALVMYISLIESVPNFLPYREAPIDCYLKAQRMPQPIQLELKKKVQDMLT